MPKANEFYDRAFREGLRPDPILTVSEWADDNRILSMRASSEPGPWRTDRTPYLREPMNKLSATDPTQVVAVIKGSQLGFTEAGNNWIGYVIEHAPGPMLAVQPTVETAKRNSKQRIDPLIEESPTLRQRVQPSRARDSGNTVLSKEFRGGVLVMTGANSAIGLRSMPARYLFLDEIDAFPADVDSEGDPVQLAFARTRTFARRKIYMVSSPTITGRSRIEMAYEGSDKRKFWVPCPECETFQTLKFEQLKWTKGNPRDARYICESCGCALGDEHKTAMLSRGKWIAEDPGPSKAAGYHISSLYSPVGWLSWVEIAQAWEEAQGKPESLKTFVNTILAETWKEKGEAPDWLRLHERAEDYPIGKVPSGVLFLTAGVDVQQDRVEIYVWGWGRGLESWLIDYRVLTGDPNADAVWEELDKVTNSTWPHEHGVDMPLVGCGADIGYATERVYNWLRKKDATRFFAVKGVDRGAVGLGMPTAFDVAERLGKKKKRRAGRLWPVVGGIYKSEFYGYLRLDRPTTESGDAYPAGYVHLAKFPEEVFKQLTAEQLVTKVVKHRRVTNWEKTRERNEALDCRVYARAAAAVFGIDRFRDQDWDALESLITTTLRKKTQAKAAEAPEVEADQEPTQPRPIRPQARSGWLGSRKNWLR